MTTKSDTIASAVSRIERAPNMSRVIDAYDAALGGSDVSAHRYRGQWQVWHGNHSGFCGDFWAVRAHLAERVEELLERAAEAEAAAETEQAPAPAPAPVMVEQPVQQQQARATAAPSADAIKANIRKLASSKKDNGAEISTLFGKLPGVVSCDYTGCMFKIVASGTICGNLSREYTLPFLFDAFGIPAFEDANKEMEAAIERNRLHKARRAEEIERDRFDREVVRTIASGPFTASVEPVEYGEVAVTVTAALRGGGSRKLGRVIMSPQPTRREVLEEAIRRLGYGYRGLDMDADDGSEIPTQARAALDETLAR